MKKIFCAIILMISMSLAMTSCSHEHVWKEATLDEPKTCAECYETSGTSIRDMLIGDWKQEDKTSIFVCVEFTESQFRGNIVVSGKKSDTLAERGTYAIEGSRLILTNNSGSTYIYFTYEILDDSIKLIDHEGNVWVKTTL